MELIHETEWRSFEEVLALALGWPIEDAKERVIQYDAAAGEKPFEFPDPIDELLSTWDPDAPMPEVVHLDPSEYEENEEVLPASPPSNIAEADLTSYLHAKRMLVQAIQNKDISYNTPPIWAEDALYQHTVLSPVHVSRWLNAMRMHDTGKLLQRLAELEKENKALRREVKQRNKFKDDISARYLKIAIEKYYKTWHIREDPSIVLPQPPIISELMEEHGLSAITAKAIEKVICPVDRNRANKSKKQA
ncbi:Uncharacterised protein [Burkholderia pseudomallei]|nr:Uncharacterised protein [Burkholderia pseudomallei]CAJ7268772.1 Uncharacterised protein [Burkholderia pseudomallei]